MDEQRASSQMQTQKKKSTQRVKGQVACEEYRETI